MNSNAVFPVLTPNERRLAELLLQAKSDIETAQEIHIKPRTVKSYMFRLFAKFALANGSAIHKRVRLAMLIHQHRELLGVRCQACGEI